MQEKCKVYKKSQQSGLQGTKKNEETDKEVRDEEVEEVGGGDEEVEEVEEGEGERGR